MFKALFASILMLASTSHVVLVGPQPQNKTEKRTPNRDRKQGVPPQRTSKNQSAQHPNRRNQAVKKKPAQKPVLSTDALGKPKAYQVDVPARLYLWNSNGVWKMRTTSNRKRGLNFRGVITAKNCQFQYCKSVARETGLRPAAKKRGIKKSQDAWRLSRDKTKITFLFLTGKLADGLDFKIASGAGSNARLNFDFVISGRRMPKGIFLGRNGAHPHKMPFSLDAQPRRKP